MASHRQLANWYAQLGQHLEAGILIADALRLTDGMPMKGRAQMADQLEAGEAFNAVMRTAPKWIPLADRHFMVAGMETGSLPCTLQNLSKRHESIGATQMKIMLGMVYPLGVFHVAAMLIPVVGMINYEVGFEWDRSTYFIHAAMWILPVWLLIAAIAWLARSQSSLLAKVLRVLPILRQYSYAQAIADLSYSIGTFVAAGVPVPSAWRLSTKIVNDPRFTRACQQLEPCFAAGQDPSEQLKALKCLPSDFVAFYRTGAQSGKLDSNLFIAGKQYQDRANNAMSLAAIVYPTIVMAIVAGLVISTIFKVYGGYINILNSFSG